MSALSNLAEINAPNVDDATLNEWLDNSDRDVRLVALAELLRRPGAVRRTDVAAKPVHTYGGSPIGPEGLPYGVTHDFTCPGCQDTPFTASPRSETYFSS